MATQQRPPIRDITVEDIEQAYKDKKLIYQDYNDLLKAKAHDSTFTALEEKGFIPAVFERMIHHANEGFKTYKEAVLAGRETPATGDYGAPSPAIAKQALMLVWGQIQMLSSFQTALGEVSGHQMENAALAMGASPGVARVLNLVTDNLVQVVPLGLTAKKVAQTVKLRGGAIREGADKEAARQADEAANAVADEETVAVENILQKGVEVETPKAPTTVAPTVTEASQVMREAQKPATSKGPFVLPKELAGAKPRYNIGQSSYELEFRSDLDKALYIVAQDTVSRRDPEYLKLVMDHLGVSESQARALGRDVRSFVKRTVIGMPSGKVSIAASRTETLGASTVAKTVEQVQEEVVADMATVTKRATPAQVKQELAEFKKRTGIDPEALAMERNWTDKQMHAYMTALQPHMDELAGSALAALSDDAKLFEFAKKVTHLFIADPTGRAKPVITTEFRELLTNWDPVSMAKGDMKTAMRSLAEDLAELATSPKEPGVTLGFGLTPFFMQMGTLYQRYGGHAWPMARELYANTLLPFAWAPTFVGNSVAGGLAVAERAAGAFFSANKGAGGYVNKEAYYLSKGMMLATGDGLKAFAGSFDPAQASAINATLGGTNRFGFEVGAIPGRLGRIMRVPGDAVRGMDNLNKTQFFRGALYARYIREADQMGLKGKAAGDYVTTQMMGPPTREAYDEARQFANSNTFQGELGKFGRVFSNLSTETPLFLWFPFVKTGLNVAKYTWNRTPGLQLISAQLYKDLAAGGAVADAAIGRLIVSNMMGSLIYDLAREGYITGAGPTDPALRKAWLATNQPYSIKTPHGHMPMFGTEPASSIMGIVADFVAVAPYLDSDSLEQGGQALAFAIFKSLGDITWFRNGANLVEAIQGVREGKPITQEALRTLLNPAITVASGGPIMNRLRGVVDPVMRETRSINDEFMNRVPGYSKSLPPMRDGYGDPVIPPAPAISNWFGLLRPIVPAFKPYETDPVKKEGERLQARLPQFGWTIGKGSAPATGLRTTFPEDETAIRLTPQQRDERIQLYNSLIRDPEFGMEAYIKSQEYNEINPKTGRPDRALQRSDFNLELSRMWREAGEQLLDKNPKLQLELELKEDRADAIREGDPMPTPRPLEAVPEPTTEELDNIQKFN